jgi:hypothetical protein
LCHVFVFTALMVQTPDCYIMVLTRSWHPGDLESQRSDTRSSAAACTHPGIVAAIHLSRCTETFLWHAFRTTFHVPQCRIFPYPGVLCPTILRTRPRSFEAFAFLITPGSVLASPPAICVLFSANGRAEETMKLSQGHYWIELNCPLQHSK